MSAEDLLKLIREVGAEIQPKLLPKPGHSTRNAFAHLHGMINTLCGATYSEADEEKVRFTIEAIRQLPNGDLKEVFEVAKELYKKKKDANAQAE